MTDTFHEKFNYSKIIKFLKKSQYHIIYIVIVRTNKNVFILQDSSQQVQHLFCRWPQTPEFYSSKHSRFWFSDLYQNLIIPGLTFPPLDFQHLLDFLLGFWLDSPWNLASTPTCLVDTIDCHLQHYCNGNKQVLDQISNIAVHTDNIASYILYMCTQ